MFVSDPSLTVNKIMVDSRFKSATSRSDTDFSIDLPESVFVPVGTRCHITDVSIVRAWYTVERNVNDKLYFMYKTPTNTYQTFITLDSQNYSLDTLAEELQTK